MSLKEWAEKMLKKSVEHEKKVSKSRPAMLFIGEKKQMWYFLMNQVDGDTEAGKDSPAAPGSGTASVAEAAAGAGTASVAEASAVAEVTPRDEAAPGSASSGSGSAGDNGAAG